MNKTPLKNDKQYNITCYWISRFQNDLDELSYHKGVHEKIRKAAVDGLKSILDILIWEKEDYERRTRK